MIGPKVLTYGLLSDWLAGRLAALGSSPELVPGPMSYTLADGTINSAVALTPGGGPGYLLEQTYDGQLWSVDVAGEQGDIASAELLAAQVDWVLGSQVTTPIRIGGVRVLHIGRAGGKPTVVGVDNADRWHLAGSYLVRVESGN